jgi:hypothetical protein
MTPTSALSMTQTIRRPPAGTVRVGGGRVERGQLLAGGEHGGPLPGLVPPPQVGLQVGDLAASARLLQPLRRARVVGGRFQQPLQRRDGVGPAALVGGLLEVEHVCRFTTSRQLPLPAGGTHQRLVLPLGS